MAQKSKPTTFSKGMISDNDQRYQEEGSYRDAQNIQLINKDGATFTVENINGNIQKIDLVNPSVTIENTPEFDTYWTGGTINFPFQNPVFSQVAGFYSNIVGHYSYNNTLLLIIVGLNDDNSVRRLKGDNRPINPVETRKKQLEILSWVDEVIVFSEDTPYNLIKSLKPNLIVKGGDYKVNEVVGHDLTSVYIVPTVEDFSTTSILEKINE